MKKIEISAGIIKNGDKVLIGQRKFEDKFGGKWEFPGGKVEPFEDSQICMIRELKEELDIDVMSINEFITYIYTDSISELTIHSYIIDKFLGSLKNLEHEQLEWVKITELRNYDILDADMEIIIQLEKEIN